jgi:PAS domain S-box-containing protein
MMKNSGRLILITGIVLFVFMLASLLMMSDALQNSNRFGELYSALLIFNTIGLLTLVLLIAMNLRQLILQARQRVAGVKLTIRMVAVFTLLSVTPVSILYYFSLDFLHRGIDSWFDIRVDEALDNSLELSRISIEMRMKELLRQTEQYAGEFSQINNAVVPFDIDSYRERSGAEELTLMTKQGSIIYASFGNPARLVPDRPDDAILFQLQQGSNYIGMDSTHGTDLMIRVVVKVPVSGMENETRILQALYPITGRMKELTDSVQNDYVQYQQLSYLQEDLKSAFTRTLTLVLLFSIFSIVWAAFYSARSLASPIRDLVEGTKSVAGGDYNTQIPVPSHDELGFLVSSFNDMTRKIARANEDVRLSQMEAEAQRAYLEAVLSRLSSGVMVLDQHKQVRTVNISSGRILGIEQQKLCDQSLSGLIHAYTYLEQLLNTINHHIDRAEDWREQITLFGTSGRQILMCSGTSLSLSEGSERVHVVLFDDITALVQGQRDAAWGEMARRLAHEIKNPLTPIKLAAERLRHKYLGVLSPQHTETMDKLTRTIVSQVETMKDMVNAFADYARKPELKTVDVNVNTLIEEVVDLFSTLDSTAQIRLHLDRQLPLIKADPSRLRQVFNNIINNAFDAAGKAAQTILDISTRHIVDTEVDYIEVVIRDSGPGLSEDIISTIFEPYVTTKKKGTGLGLAIVKKIIEEHGGLVLLENNPDGPGACAIIRLPVAVRNITPLPPRLAQENK